MLDVLLLDIRTATTKWEETVRQIGECLKGKKKKE